MRLSACVIVKNEEKNIGRWLECMRSIADEIIVVDTGSTDSTVDIARAAGARVEHFTWIDDFAAAKNYALDLASGDWIAFLDADEYFTADSIIKIRPTLEAINDNRRLVGLMTKLINVDTSGNSLGTSFYKARLFRRLPWLRYVGSIHENIENLNPAIPQEIRRTDELVIYHTGYAPEVMAAKAERNLTLILNRREREGEHPLDAFHLACAYNTLGRWSEAVRYARLAIADSHQPLGLEIRPYQILLKALVLGGAELADIESALAMGLARFPEAPELYVFGGEGRWENGNHAAAAKLFHRAIELEKKAAQPMGEALLAVVNQRLGEWAKEQEPGQGKIRISACAITKNEEKNIGRWLECMRSIADEIIVVDTGSTDSTVEIARAAGARVEYFAWIDDFAAAKNYALDLASGDWIAFLDADEYFSAESIAKIQQVLAAVDDNKRIAGFIIRIVNIDSSGRDMGTIFYKTPLFRRLPWIRYVGSIHENLQNLNRAIPQEMSQTDELTIYHTGYSPEIVLGKLERNLELILARREREGEKPLDDFYLADCYYGLKNYRAAVHHARLAIASPYKAVGLEIQPYQVLLQCLVLGDFPLEDIEQALAEATARYPKAAELYIIAGDGRWTRGAYAASAELFRRGIELAEAEERPSQGRNLLPLAYRRLGELSLAQNNREAAFDALLAGVRLKPRSQAILWLLLRAMEGLEDSDIIALLNSIYDRERDASYLASVLADAGREIALYYNRYAGTLDTATCYLLAGRVEEGAALAIEERERLECVRAALAGITLTVGDGYQRRRISARAARLAEYLNNN